ncbi:MAG: hypothetical protein E7522_10880 [Ruminococcaceae bacterium]|nr:hypothetical protein [Oscillospiraceae bacterium]
MKKALRVLSIINCIVCGYVLLMYIDLAVIGYSDSVGFLLIFICTALSYVTFLLWSIYSFIQKNTKLKVAAIASVILYVGYEMFFYSGLSNRLLPLEIQVSISWVKWMIPLVLTILLLIVEKKSVGVGKSNEN